MGCPVELTEAELQVICVVWSLGEVSARKVVETLVRECDYSASTAYTLVYRCIKKGALGRRDPGFVLTPLVEREEVQDYETRRLADRLFDGSVDELFAALVDRRKVSRKAVERMGALIDSYEGENATD